MSITTLAVVNPYTSDISVAKTVARAISYDYAADMQALSGHVSARADLIKKGEKQITQIIICCMIYILIV